MGDADYNSCSSAIIPIVCSRTCFDPHINDLMLSRKFSSWKAEYSSRDPCCLTSAIFFMQPSKQQCMGKSAHISIRKFFNGCRQCDVVDAPFVSLVSSKWVSNFRKSHLIIIQPILWTFVTPLVPTVQFCLFYKAACWSVTYKAVNMHPKLAVYCLHISFAQWTWGDIN